MMMQTKYDYCSDVFFKYLFGRNEEESLFLRKFFLNALIPFEISEVFIDNLELIPRFICNRNVILDIYMQKSDIETVYKEKDKLSEWEAMIYLMYKGTLEGILYEEKKE